MSDRKISKAEFKRIVDQVCESLAVADSLSRTPEIDYWHRIWFKTEEFLGNDMPMLMPNERGPLIDSIRQQLLNLLVRSGTERIDTNIAAIAIEQARA